MKKIILTTLIFLVLPYQFYGQKVKFSNLGYKIEYNKTNHQLIDSITFSFSIKYKNIDDVLKEINYVRFDYGYIGDSIISIISMVNIRVENKILKNDLPKREASRLLISGNSLRYKVYIGDLALSDISFVSFDVEYSEFYHVKYHNTKPIDIGKMKGKGLEEAFDVGRKKKFFYK